MPKIKGRTPAHGEVQRIEDADGKRIPVAKFQVTDKALGLAAGNTYEVKPAPHAISQWGANVDPLSGQPSLDQNPYNFVPLAAGGPWLEKSPHPDHEAERTEQVSGWLEYQIELKTPLFVPEGFPAPRQLSSQEQEKLKEVPRHFCRMQDETGTVRYVVPGSSLKGLIRSEVEALTGSLFGAIDRKAHQRRHLYRRRALDSAGVVEDTSTTTWKVREAKLLYVDANDWRPNGFLFPTKYDVVASHRAGRPISRMKAVPPGYTLDPRKYEAYVLRPPRGTTDCVEYLGSLFARPDDKTYSHLLIFKGGNTFDLDEEVRSTYHQDVLKHPHFEEHWEKSGTKYSWPSGLTGDVGWDNVKDTVETDLHLTLGDLVFFTAENRKITTIGKNINYLWPANRSVQSLALSYFLPVDPGDDTEIRSLDEPLALAERMFGFAAKHSRDPKSHPFKGRASVEAAWGPESENYDAERNWPELTPESSIPPSSRGVRLELAPVTGPTARAKSRPLYLQPGNSKSASYDDPSPALQGRKFHWHQNNADPTRPIWKFHLYNDDWHSQVKKQSPAPLCALTPIAENTLQGRIRFRNLIKIELGALLYALEGPSADHCLKLGKAKARGLGSVRFSVTGASKINLVARYASLDERAGIEEISKDERADAIKEFLAWHGSKEDSNKILQAHTKLHAFPAERSVRYFPINFRDYGWLPGSEKNNTNGEPQGGAPKRPRGMMPAWR